MNFHIFLKVEIAFSSLYNLFYCCFSRYTVPSFFIEVYIFLSFAFTCQITTFVFNAWCGYIILVGFSKGICTSLVQIKYFWFSFISLGYSGFLFLVSFLILFLEVFDEFPTSLTMILLLGYYFGWKLYPMTFIADTSLHSLRIIWNYLYEQIWFLRGCNWILEASLINCGAHY